MEKFLLGLVKNEEIFWTKTEGESTDVVLSTRVRLARNYREFPFSAKISEQQAEELINTLRSGMVKEKNLYFIDLSLFPEELKIALFEKHLISKELATKAMPAGLIINKENDLSIMVNEEDHLRIQAFESGLNFLEALKKAADKDDFFSTLGKYAFDNELGFYTSCPSNFGTGLRASIMVHLPAILEMGSINQLTKELYKAGYAVRGMYGEGTESWGGFFQISNQLTTGISEEEIIQRISVAAENLVKQEREFRTEILAKKRISLEDKVFRAYGLLKNARIISQKEAILNISLLRMGVIEKLIDEISLSDVNKLILFSNAYYLKVLDPELEDKQIYCKRAEMIRKKLDGSK